MFPCSRPELVLLSGDAEGHVAISERMEIVVLEMEEEIAGGEGEGKKEQVFKSKSALF